MKEYWKIPTPRTAAIARMYTAFISLLEHFIPHYSNQPCCSECPCHQRDHQVVRAATDRLAEVSSNSLTLPTEIDKKGSSWSKFYCDINDSNDQGVLVKLSTQVLPKVLKNMGSILHGLNTCGAEQFARERLQHNNL